jgi:uncharacterized membrane protein
MESFKTLTLWFAAGSEAAAALVIGLATIEATLRALVAFVRHSSPANALGQAHDEKERIRLRLGRWLALALEFLLAADILRTAVAPTWNEIGQLAAIVVLRTLLNYFLQKEIDTAEDREERRAERGRVP